MLVWRTLHDEGLYPYHYRGVQLLNEEDYMRRQVFCEWYLRQNVANDDFAKKILRSDKSTFTRAGIFNQHNLHLWKRSNPHAPRPCHFQHEIRVNVWAGILGDHVIGPYIFPEKLTGSTYLIFLREVLPLLLEDVPIEARRNMWFQQDGCPAHFAGYVRDYLQDNFPNRWIGRGGVVGWPARSPDLTCLDYFIWGYIKSLVYETPVTSTEDLIGRIIDRFGKIRDFPQMLSRVRANMEKRCRACVEVDGGIFEPKLN